MLWKKVNRLRRMGNAHMGVVKESLGRTLCKVFSTYEAFDKSWQAHVCVKCAPVMCKSI